MKKIVKITGGVVAACAVVFVGLMISLATIDANKYRPQLVAALSKQTGREVKLDGAIAFSLGLSGITISAQDASIANPTWGSRPALASMGKFELGIGLLPLLAHHLSITQLSIENADILLETSQAGQRNWDLGGAEKQSAPPVSSASASLTPSLSIDKLKILNSQLALRGADGKISSVNVSSLTLDMRGTGAALKFIGDVNGTALTLDVTTGITDLLSKAAFSFAGDMTYDRFFLKIKGIADLGNSKAELSSYELTAGKTDITGDVVVAWNAARPTIRGTLTGNSINPADFKSDTAASGNTSASQSQAETTSGSKRLFSDAPLPLQALRSVDADLTISVGEFPVGAEVLRQISAKLSLLNGNLVIAPIKAVIGTVPVDAQVKLDASQSPAHLAIGLIGNGIDLSDVQKLGDMSPFMTGKAGANIQLSSTGDSAHDMAASLGGVITITAEKGEMIGSETSSISSALAAVLNPNGGNVALNCLAARFIAKEGVLKDNGLLIDSVPSTIAGQGNVNLGNETVDMVLRAKTKLVDIGGLVPSVKINGTLVNPHYKIDAASVVKGVIGSLMKGNVDVIASTVPDMQTPPAGQNACVYTLDHPQAADTSGPLPPDAVGKASQKIQNIGNSLLKGLFGNK